MENNKEQNPDRNDLIQQDTTADKALDVGAFVSAVLPIPWLAPAVSFVLGGISNQRKIKRIQEALRQLNEEIGDFKSEASEKYVDSEEFEELVERTLQQIANERHEQKRNMYGRFLAGAIKSPGDPYDEQIRFLRDLELLQADHIRIFQAMLQEPDPNSNVYIGSTMTTLSERLSDISESRLRELVAYLNDMKLISGIGNTMVTARTAVDLRNNFTPYGQRFVRYLNSKED
ncbi:MAG: hypothetical protein H6653_05610 [Ardenticatenaceae bacterium]|nr:hypothetical protein [Ardenticatenaceae bacterium]